MRIKILLVLALVLAVNVTAQNVDKKGIEAFVNDLKALDDEHVEYNIAGYDSLMNNIISQIKEQTDDNFNESLIRKKLCDTEWNIISVTSADEKGYSIMCDLIAAYDLDVVENFYGIPLVASTREDGCQEIVFTGNGYTIVIRDDVDYEMEIFYSNCNMFEIIQQALTMMLMGFDEDFIEDNALFDFSDVSFSFGTAKKERSKEKPVVNVSKPIGSYPEDIIAAVSDDYKDKLNSLEMQQLSAGKQEREELQDEIEELRDGMAEELEDLREKMKGVEMPELISVYDIGKSYVVIPAFPENLKNEMMPYAANGVYDWINETGFADENLDHISYIVTPEDVVVEYAVRHWPRNRWYYDGYSEEVKNAYALEFQGGTPAILCRFSQNEKGYNKMKADFETLFTLGLEGKFHNLEVVQNSERNGKRFVQLYGEGDIMMCVFDSPTDKYCHMSIIIGYDAFQQAVNESVMGDERDIAKKCNIIITDDFSHRLGIQFCDKEYQHLGKNYKNGVHIDFGYARKMFLGNNQGAE